MNAKPACLAAAAILLSVTASRPAVAGSVLATGVLPSAQAGADTTLCQAVNVGTKDVEVTLEIVNADDGSVLTTSIATLQPTQVMNAGSAAVINNQYCRATGLSAKTGRLTMSTVDNATVLMTVTAP